jgi:hypothetical protein
MKKKFPVFQSMEGCNMWLVLDRTIHQVDQIYLKKAPNPDPHIAFHVVSDTKNIILNK